MGRAAATRKSPGLVCEFDHGVPGRGIRNGRNNFGDVKTHIAACPQSVGADINQVWFIMNGWTRGINGAHVCTAGGERATAPRRPPWVASLSPGRYR
jgi:hypothetical protein